jgi:hypothetical protein
MGKRTQCVSLPRLAFSGGTYASDKPTVDLEKLGT